MMRAVFAGLISLTLYGIRCLLYVTKPCDGGSKCTRAHHRRPPLRSGLNGPRLDRSVTSGDWVTGILPHHSVKIQGWRQSGAALAFGPAWASPSSAATLFGTF